MCGVVEPAAIIKAEPASDVLTSSDTLTLHAGPASSTLCLPNGTPFTLPQEISFTLATLTPSGQLTFSAAPPPSCSSSSSPLEEGPAALASLEGVEFPGVGVAQLASLLPAAGHGPLLAAAARSPLLSITEVTNTLLDNNQ
jgi:hypothetical protein